ncbi:hypothetical protein D3C71_945450 [compost metagenome]
MTKRKINWSAYKPIDHKGKYLFVYKYIAEEFDQELDALLTAAKLIGNQMMYEDKTSNDEETPCLLYRFKIGDAVANLKLLVKVHSRRCLKEISIQTTNKDLMAKWENIVETNNFKHNSIMVHEIAGDDLDSMINVLKVLRLSL